MSDSPMRRPLLASQDLKSPPPSHKHPLPKDGMKRRRFFQYTDGPEGVLTIETFIYKMDKFRSSTAEFPLPHPLKREPPPPKVNSQLSEGASFRQSLFSLLKAHDVKASHAWFDVVSKPGYPTQPTTGHSGDQKVLTLFIRVKQPDTSLDHEWSPAKRACLEILNKHGIDDVVVEILDTTKAFLPICFAVEPTDPCLAAYNTFSDRLVDELIQKLKGNWLGMTMYRVGSVLSKPMESMTEIVIIVKPYTNHNWYSLVHRIKDQFINKSQVGDTNFGVIIMPGFHGNLPTMPGISFLDRLDEWPSAGASIGVQGEQGGGTHGGYFTLTRKQSRRVFLTTSHVTRPKESADKNVQEAYDRYGVPRENEADPKLGDLNSRRSIIIYPAAKDLDATRRQASQIIAHHIRSQEEVDAAQKLKDEDRPEDLQEWDRDPSYSRRTDQRLVLGLIPEYMQQIRTARIKEKPTGHLEQTLENLKSSLNRAQKSLDDCKSFPKQVGKVLIASGRALGCEKRILDYSFVEVANQKDLQNHAARYNDLPTSRGSPDALIQGTGGVHEKLWPRDSPHDPSTPMAGVIEDFARLKLGELVFKQGRTTKLTVGVCNGVEAYVSLAGWRTPYDAQGRPGPWTHVKYTKEYVIAIAPSPPDQPEIKPDLEDDDFKYQDNFAMCGDSGALLHNRDGQAVALLHGALGGACGKFHWNPVEQVSWPLVEGEQQKIHEEDFEGGIYTNYNTSHGLVTPLQDIIDHLKAWADVDLSI